MKNRTKSLIFYFLYTVFIMGVTTTAVFALRGYCYAQEGSSYVAVKCDCPCESKDRDWSRNFCRRCEHFII